MPPQTGEWPVGGGCIDFGILTRNANNIVIEGFRIRPSDGDPKDIKVITWT